jgi:hypothetical protein
VTVCRPVRDGSHHQRGGGGGGGGHGSQVHVVHALVGCAYLYTRLELIVLTLLFRMMDSVKCMTIDPSSDVVSFERIFQIFI